MCRSIKVLRTGQEMATVEEIEAAALQFVRKVSGYRTPSQKNREPFDEAVRDITAISRQLLEALTAPGGSHDGYAHAGTFDAVHVGARSKPRASR
jgi:hypothetical protein